MQLHPKWKAKKAKKEKKEGPAMMRWPSLPKPVALEVLKFKPL